MTTTRAVRAIAFALSAFPCYVSAADGVDGRELPPQRPVRVQASFRLSGVNAIDDENETFEFTGILKLVWNDERRSFDPEEKGVRELVYTGAFQFNELAPLWYPHVVLTNVSGTCDRGNVVLRVKPDGTCVLVETFNAVAESKLNLRAYPFDDQRLQAVFAVLGFDSDEVVLIVPEETPYNTKIRVPQWSLDSVTADSEVAGSNTSGPASGNTASLVLTAQVRRAPFFVVRLVVLPLVLIVTLSWSVFWMNRGAAGDRLSVSFVGILTAVAYQMVIGDILPQISYMTFIHAFLSFGFILMCVTVPANLYVASCEAQGHAQRALRVDLLCRWLFPVAYLTLMCVAGFWFLLFN